MSDVENQPFFNIQRVYLKDMSLEQPNSPAIFLEQDMPSVEVEVDVKADRLAESVFEVVVSGTVTAKVKDKIAFLIEAKQAGIFDIRNIPDEQLDRSSASPARRSCSRTCVRTSPTRSRVRASRRSTWRKSTSRRCTNNASRSFSSRPVPQQAHRTARR